MSVSLPPAPTAKIDPKELVTHGDLRVDPYFWLRDRSHPEVIAHLEAENAYTDVVLADTEDLQQQLYDEILGRIQETDTSVPVRRDGWEYYTRTEQGRSYAIYCRKQGAEQILLDANELAAPFEYFRLGVFSPSPDHRTLAYSTDTKGNESFTLVFKDLATGELLSDRIEHTYYEFAWAADNRTVFYNKLDAAHRPYQVWRHTLGSGEPDVLVYEEKDERFLCGIDKTRDEQYLLITSNSSTSSEIHYLPAADPLAPLRVIAPRRPNVEYDAGHQHGYFLIHTNLEATNFRLMRAPADTPDAWEEVVAHRPDVYLEGFAEFNRHLVLYERANGLRRLNVNQSHYIDFPEPAYHLTSQSNPNFDTDHFRFGYTSLVTPSSVFDYHMGTRERTLLKQEPVLGGYDASEYTTERIWASAPDGTRVPMAVVYRNDFQKNGQAPFLLYGYGSYGLNIEATFSSQRLSLLDRGFGVAIANIRGGSEMGRPWYENGKFLHKPNTFTDFIACAEHLIAERYTNPQKLAIEGRSAGGLLIGAVLNLRPDLFGAALAGVPFVDCLTTMLDESLPLTIGEYEEWGDPNDPQFYNALKSYSPYDNVKPGPYPHLLVTSGLNDPRVSYWEPTKWVAKLRTVKTNNTMLLLKTNMGGGHFGKSGRYEALKETALYYAFFLKALGILDR